MKSKFILLSAAMFAALGASAQHNVSSNGKKRVMLYEGSGAWCMHCSDGAVYVEKNLTQFPDQLVAISVHNNDAMSTPNGNIIDASLENGWPWGSVDMTFFNNIKKASGSPQQIADTPNISLNRGYWASAITERLAVPAKFDITMTHSYNKTTRELTVNVEAKALADAPGDYNINVFLTEDKVVGPDDAGYNQTNASTYNNNASHPLYNKNNNAAKTKIIGFEHNHVVRASLGGPWGVAGPSNAKKDGVTKKEFKFTIPAQMGTPALNVKLDQMHLVAVVHGKIAGSVAVPNPKNASVDNALGAKMLPWNPNDVNDIKNSSVFTVSPNPASTTINVNATLASAGSAKVTISNLVGQTIIAEKYTTKGTSLNENISVGNLANGIYIVKIECNGEVSSQKIVVNH